MTPGSRDPADTSEHEQSTFIPTCKQVFYFLWFGLMQGRNHRSAWGLQISGRLMWVWHDWLFIFSLFLRFTLAFVAIVQRADRKESGRKRGDGTTSQDSNSPETQPCYVSQCCPQAIRYDVPTSYELLFRSLDLVMHQDEKSWLMPNRTQWAKENYTENN